MESFTEFLPEPLPQEAVQRLIEVMSQALLCRYAEKGSMNSEAAKLEQDFARLLGRPYSLAVNSGASAIFLALLAAGVKSGDKVLLPAFTFTTVASAIVNVGAEVVLVDTMDNYCIDVDDLESKARCGARFLLLSYMRGHAARLDEILRICKRVGIRVIEDCAHSLGTNWKGVPTGTFGIASCFSFQDKLINAGEGGMLVTSDPDLYMRATIYSGSYEQLWRTHSSRPDEENKYQGELPQYSLRMSNLTAAVARQQIPGLEKKILRYRQLLTLIRNIVGKSSSCVLPLFDKDVEFVSDTLQFALPRADARVAQSVSEGLRSRGIPVAPFGFTPGNARCYWNWRYLNGHEGLKNTRDLLNRSFDVKLRATMSDEFADFIGKSIVEVAAHAARS